MATMTRSRDLSDAIVQFAINGEFPDAVSELPPVSGTDLQPVIDALDTAKGELQTEIRLINKETKNDFDAWVKNAKTLQEDIIKSKAIANDILRQSKLPDTSGQSVEDAEAKADFFNREAQYTQQLRLILDKAGRVKQLFDAAIVASSQGRFLDTLSLLSESQAALNHVGVPRSCRMMRLLESRHSELKLKLRQSLDQIWKVLVHVDAAEASLIILEKTENISLSDVAAALKSYNEIDERMEQFWRMLNATLIAPRIDKTRISRPSVVASDVSLLLQGDSDDSIEALYSDLETIWSFIAKKLPQGLLKSLSRSMVHEIVPKLIQIWIQPAVPVSLAELKVFQQIILHTRSFCESLQLWGYSGFEELQSWADQAPQTWLAKCREHALNMVRTNLKLGIGKSKEVKKIEKQVVSISEGRELAFSGGGAGAAADANDWGDDWGDAWDDEANQDEPSLQNANKDVDPEDNGVNAWGWTEDEAGHGNTSSDANFPDPNAAASKHSFAHARMERRSQNDRDGPADPWRLQHPQHTRELVLKESYRITSMPEPLLEIIVTIFEDAAALTTGSDEFNVVASTAPGLFGLPTLLLALFRAISPHFYALDVGGSMFLYNDAMYIAEKLAEFTATWKQRDDLTPRAQSMFRLDNDVKALQSFANRSYSNEMSTQKTVLQDLMGGSQSLLQQEEMESAVEAGAARIRTVAATWEPILARSVWSQAVGSLADALATRLISDVLDMSSIGQDEAYRVAQLIATATELDDLFEPSSLHANEASFPTAQYSPHWLRLKFLGEVLQSNLNEVRYLWCDSELSLYFTLDEVVDLIQASFEDNARTRDTIKEIRSKPHPIAAAEL